MTQAPQPPLKEQIEAVALAAEHFFTIGALAKLEPTDIQAIRRRLKAAVETLEHLDFMRETLN